MHTYGSESKGGTRTHKSKSGVGAGVGVPDRCRVGEKVGDSLRAESRRAALAKKKLMRDQQRLKDIMRHIRASRGGAGPRDLHRALNLVSAQYDVDLPNGYTRQLNGEFVWWEMSRAPPGIPGSPCAFLGPKKARIRGWGHGRVHGHVMGSADARLLAQANTDQSTGHERMPAMQGALTSRQILTWDSQPRKVSIPRPLWLPSM